MISLLGSKFSLVVLLAEIFVVHDVLALGSELSVLVPLAEVFLVVVFVFVVAYP